MMLQVARIVTPVTWLAAPEWLTVQEAAELSGHDRGVLHWMIRDGAVDTKLEGDIYLIEKVSLWEFQEALAEVLHWWE